jgi:hypothetical protein
VNSLPASLRYAIFWGCEYLVGLPEQLPVELGELWLAGTAIKSLPQLPPKLEQLDARCCPNLVETSQHWPEWGTLHWLNLCNTPVAKQLSGNLPEGVLERVRQRGVAGWRYNQLSGGVMRA